jgi:hypothetical protein
MDRIGGCRVTQHIIALHEKLFTEYLDICDADLEKKREIKRKKEKEMMENYKREERKKGDKERRKEEKKRRKEKDRSARQGSSSGGGRRRRVADDARQDDDDDASAMAPTKKRTSSSDNIDGGADGRGGASGAAPDRHFTHTTRGDISAATRNFVALDIDGAALHRRSLSMNSAAIAEMLNSAAADVAMPRIGGASGSTPKSGPLGRRDVKPANDLIVSTAPLRSSSGLVPKAPTAGATTKRRSNSISGTAQIESNERRALSSSAKATTTLSAGAAIGGPALVDTANGSKSSGRTSSESSDRSQQRTTNSNSDSDSSSSSSSSSSASGKSIASASSMAKAAVSAALDPNERWRAAFFVLLVVFVLSNLMQ